MVHIHSKAPAILTALCVAGSRIDAFTIRIPPMKAVVATRPNAPSRTGSLASNPNHQQETLDKEEEPVVSVSHPQRECMQAAGRPKIQMVEHGLPTALQTHEMLVKGNHILATQMEEGRLVRLNHDKGTGKISSVVDSVTFGQTEEADPFVGLHGLCESFLFPGRAWVTLQYINKLCLVNIETMEVESTIKCPRDLPGGLTVGGPHCATEKNGKLYVCMKGGASCHGTTTSREMAEEATAHGVWRVELDPETGNTKNEGTLFRVPPTPVMCVVDDDENAWVVTDEHGSITKIPFDARCSGCVQDILLPYQYSLYHQSGPGIQIGPDGNPWFCILNGEGIVGKVNRATNEVTVFELMSASWNPNPRICHISWDKSNILYAISSDLLDKVAVNTLIRVKFDPTYEQVIAQHELALPSQESCIHRIAHIDDAKEPSVLVSELTQSQILQVFKASLPPLENFPAKTMQLNVRRVYDALKPCPRTGNPVCLCEFDQDSIAIPADGPTFEGQEILYDPKILAMGEPYVNPRTGEDQLLFRGGSTWPTEIVTNYPHSGYSMSEVKSDLYAANGAPKRQSKKSTSGKAGVMNTAGNEGVVKYHPDKLMDTLRREPARIPIMIKEIEAAGMTVEQVQAILDGTSTQQENVTMENVDAKENNHDKSDDFITEKLESLTISDLKEICREKKLSGWSKLKKNELIAFLKEST